jgi:hypothetical protein
MLRIRGARILREGTLFEVGYIRGSRVARGFIFDPLREQSANSAADHPVRQNVFLQQSVDHGGN